MTGNATFRQKAPIVARWLMRDFHLKDFQAFGILGNTGRECLGFTKLREIGQPEGRGGYGWQQWTGPRARDFLNWCQKNCFDWKSDAGNYGFLQHELSGEYAYVIMRLKKTKTLEEATEIFEKFYERAGVPAMADRIAWARMAESAYHATEKK